MKRKLVVLTALAIALMNLLFISAAIAQTDPAAAVASGIKKFDAKDYNGAREEFAKIIPQSDGKDKGDAYLYLLKSNYFLNDHDSLDAAYKTYQSQLKGTAYEPAAMFVYANSLKDNKKDHASAEALYDKTAVDFPASPFAAPGSLLASGEIKIKNLNKIDDGIQALRKLITDYPESPYADDAFVQIMEGYYRLKDRDSIEKTRNELKEKFPNSKTSLANATLTLAEYCIKVERNRDDAIKFYTECYEQYPDVATNRIAKIRAADLVPFNDIRKSIELYNDVLLKKEKLSTDHEAWCYFQLGFAEILAENKDLAKDNLKKVIDYPKANKKYVEKAKQYLNALENPKSYDGSKLAVDCAIRYRRDCALLDSESKSYSAYIGAYNDGALDQVMKNSKSTSEEKAIALYDLGIAWYYNGNREKAEEIANQIIKEYPDGGYGYNMARFMIAFIKALGGKYNDAIDIYLDILNDSPEIKIAPRILQEVAKCAMRMGEEKLAIDTYDAISLLYPYRFESKESKNSLKIIMHGNSEMQTAFEKSKLTGEDGIKILSELMKNSDEFKKSVYSTIDKLRVYNVQKPEKEESFYERNVAMK